MIYENVCQISNKSKSHIKTKFLRKEMYSNIENSEKSPGFRVMGDFSSLHGFWTLEIIYIITFLSYNNIQEPQPLWLSVVL